MIAVSGDLGLGPSIEKLDDDTDQRLHQLHRSIASEVDLYFEELAEPCLVRRFRGECIEVGAMRSGERRNAQVSNLVYAKHAAQGLQKRVFMQSAGRLRRRRLRDRLH
jgi:hypothetical protein